MSQLLLNILTLAYGVGGVVTLLGYIPTVRDLYNGKPSANLITYLIWLVTTFIATLYGLFVIKDAIYLLVVGLQLVACLIITVMRFRLNNNLKIIKNKKC